MKKLRSMIHAWVDGSTRAELDELVAALGTSHATIYQLSQGVRQASPERGLQLEAITKAMSRPGLPALVCGDVSETCRACPHFRKSVGRHRALLSELGPAGDAKR